MNGLQPLTGFDIASASDGLAWLPQALWLLVTYDALKVLAYYLMPLALLALVARRRALSSRSTILLFGSFLAACAAIQAIGIWTFWQGGEEEVTFGLEVVSGLIALASALVLAPVLGKSLAGRGAADLARIGAQLQRAVREREQIEAELGRAREELQRRVEERTRALTEANERLRREVRERRRTQLRMVHLAHYDHLTGLPNRVLLQDRLRQALAQARRERCRTAFMLLDLDHFKDINDTLGHPTGDALLRLVAERLAPLVRATDTLARLGGDEFAVIQTSLQDVAGAAVLAQKLTDALAHPFQLQGQGVHVGASIGISVYPDDALDPQQLMADADMALYRAKAHGRGTYQFFAPDMIAAAQARKMLERDLRLALRCNQLVLFYQPQIDLGSGRVTGAEALVRWQHPAQGLIPPLAFISLAESTGLIRPLGEWVLREACREARRWQKAGWPVPVAVNLSAAQFRQQNVADQITAILAETGLDPEQLNLEITESLFIEHADVAHTLRRLGDLGVGLAIDDFGTGFSSLAYLQRFPVRKIKIDKSFVFGIGIDPDAEAITQALIALAHNLGKRVTAEGVETRAQLEFLRRQQCDEVQGFLCGRPVPPQEFTPSQLAAA